MAQRKKRRESGSKENPTKVPGPVINQPEHDGNIIYLAEDTMPSDLYYYDKGSNQTINCTRLLHALASFNEHSALNDWPAKRDQEKSAENLKNHEEKFRKKFGEITDIILNGKLKLHLLLNAESGREYAYNEILTLMNYIRFRNGLVEAYGKEKVMGYPALTFIHTDTRYALAKSQFKWYLDWYDKDTLPSKRRRDKSSVKRRSKIEKRIRDQVFQTRTFLRENANPDMRKEINQVLYDSEGALKDPPEFIFTGRELFEFGIIHQIFTDIEALKRKFSASLIA